MITREEIENIAILSKLFVTDDELDTLTVEMQKIVDFADAINDVDESKTEFDSTDEIKNAFREDEVVQSYPKEEILKNASDTDKDHFLVRKRA